MKGNSVRKNNKKIGLFVILHNIRSCYNVGSVFRTSDALGVEKIFLGGYTPNPENNSAIKKTALGAENMVKWEAHRQTHRILKKLKSQGITIVALELTAKSIDLEDFEPNFPFALLLGNEVTGLSSAMLKYADYVVQIPMLGEKESLNVSVSYGIAMYTMKRKMERGLRTKN